MRLIVIAITVFIIFASYTASACEDGHWIQEVTGNGSIVILEDGSIWKIASYDTYMTRIWLPTDDIIACDDKLINVDGGEKVSATRIR